MRLLVLVLLFVAEAGRAASNAPVAAKNGMVVTAQEHATRIGVEVLRNGGNAIDAAVAVGYALAVVYPAAGNLGGGGFMTLQLADGRKTFIDFRETAPLAATATMYLDANGNVIPDRSTRGYLAVAVPGTVSGLEYARAKYGTMKLVRLIAPSITLAERGYVLAQGDVDMLHEATDDFRKDQASAAIFLDRNQPFEAGATFRQRDLARTLRNISLRGADGFYKGETAAALVAASRAGKGILTQADLDAYQTRELAPVECDYRGFHVVAAPPPSSGGIVLCEILNVLEGYPLREYGYASARAVHVEIEAMRHAYVDRNHLLGDPAFVNNPTERLLDKRYAETLRSQIDLQHAGNSAQLKPGIAAREGTHTTHYSIADRFGNAVAVTYTLNDWFGARVTAAGTGVLLNNEMDDFTAKAGCRQHVRARAERHQQDRAGQAAAEFDDTHDRHARRQALDDHRHSGRQPHHYRGDADDVERDRLRHGLAGGGRCAAHPPAVAAGGNLCRGEGAESGYTRVVSCHGTQAGCAAARESRCGHPDWRAGAECETRGRNDFLRRHRSAAEHRARAGILRCGPFC